VYDRKTVRRRRAVLALLVACSLILVTASFGDGLRSVERGALEVFGPIQDGTSRVLEPFGDALSWIGDTIEAKGDVADLRAERDALRRELAEARAAMRENAELRRLLEMDKRASIADQGVVTARVSSRSPTLWHSRITVNKGSRDGVREGQPVINGAGLVGRVIRVSSRNASVLLITDSDSGVAARVVEANTTGILETAVGDPDDLRLQDLSSDRRIRENQTVVTSGSTSERFPSRFPPDLPVGRVIRVDADEGTVHVRPFANLRELDYVQILTNPAT
jgi:rod shape-determining protein MreC